ncbi:hypothetical protein HHK02_03345 [Limosilactobacillus reuteri]|uniref:Putative sugar diacid recognition domain-containing protein n=1 Tax=Limosilactobacillus reuteri TaxID=1598 RepID=A0A7L6BJF1_LIMRT|nr:hypothetical protein HHK02_03345 [Limosilactobacillus reuteri]
MELKPELAQSIVDHMMTQIPYNINIMNKKGYIIASGNKSRINTLHVGAVDAIKHYQWSNNMEIMDSQALICP